MTFGLVLAEAAIVLAAVATLAGGPLVVRIFRLAERPRPGSGPDGEDESGSVAPLTRAAADLRGGEWIGMLERLAVFATILAGYPEGIAVAMVLKVIGINPTGWLGGKAKAFAWKKMQSRAEAMRLAA